ncbi:MAG: ankyrin repeat domain-containing protein [Myxococcales bacterium]|nr:MAG: ankyrin repeat domain-containing protein [Myxococcales bacterium]
MSSYIVFFMLSISFISATSRADSLCRELFSAIENNDESKVLMLSYKYGKKAGQCVDNFGFNAMHFFASISKNLNVFYMLKYMAKADLNALNDYQQTPLMLAAHTGNKAAVKFLLSEGKVIKGLNTQDKHGRCALHGAVLANHASMVELLLSYDGIVGSIDLGLKDNNQKTAYMLAWDMQLDEIKRIFQRHSESLYSDRLMSKDVIPITLPPPIDTRYSINNG